MRFAPSGISIVAGVKTFSSEHDIIPKQRKQHIAHSMIVRIIKHSLKLIFSIFSVICDLIDVFIMDSKDEVKVVF